MNMLERIDHAIATEEDRKEFETALQQAYKGLNTMQLFEMLAYEIYKLQQQHQEIVKRMGGS